MIAEKVFGVFQRDIFLLVLNLFAGAIVARRLGPSVTGIWVILSLVPSYAEALCRTKADLAAVYFLGRKNYKEQDILKSLNYIAATTSLAFVIFGMWQIKPLHNWLFQTEERHYIYELQALLFQVPLQFLYLNYAYFHLASDNINTYNRMAVIQGFTNASLGIILVVWTDLGLWAVIISAMVGFGCGLLYGWVALVGNRLERGKLSLRLTFKILRYAANFYSSGLLSQLQHYGLHLFALNWLVPSQMAFLTQGQGVGKLLQKFVDPFNTVLFPDISRLESDNAKERSCQAFRIACCLLFSMAIILGLIAKPAIVFIYGIEFRTTAMVVHLLLPGIVISGASGILANYFNGTGSAKFIPAVTILPVIVQLCLAWLMLRKWGLVGAAGAISIGMSIYGVSLIALFLFVSKVKAVSLIPKRADFVILLSFSFAWLKNKLS